MIIKPGQVENSIRSKSNSNFILIYGPNEGLIREVINKFTSSYNLDSEVDEITIYGKDLDSDNYLLMNEIKTFSMFSSKKIIQIERIKETQIERLIEVEEYLNQNIMILVKSDNLNKNSKIRSFFEKSKSAVSIACYEDDMRSMMNLIQEFQNQYSVKFTKECKEFLLQNLSTDRLISLSELEKILLIPGLKSNQVITLENIEKIFNDGSNNNIQTIIEHVMYGRINKASKSIHKIYKEGINPVAIIRSLLNYLTRIHLTQIELKKNKSFDDAIKALKPPVFWKDKDQFHAYCNKWSSKQIATSIGKLINAEYKCKSKSNFNNEIAERSIISIASVGNTFFKN